MRKVIFVMLLALVVTSCKKEEKKTLAMNREMDEPSVNDTYAKLYGNWVGDFVALNYTENDPEEETDFGYSNKINLVIKKIEGNEVFGISIVAGNSRPLTGTLQDKNGKYILDLAEPGDQKLDGKFKFTIDKDSLKGNWILNNKKAANVWKREYKLTKQAFRYNPKLMLPKREEDIEDAYVDWYSRREDSTGYKDDDGKMQYFAREKYRFAGDIVTKLNGSTTLLKESDVKNLSKLELEIIRNTIFARHGYTFKKKNARQFFDPVDWYIPVSADVTSQLTSIEQKNIVLLNRFQKYAEDTYDNFGR